jgi:hypothetical protein
MLELKALVLSLSSALTALTALTACDYDEGRVGECGALHPMLLATSTLRRDLVFHAPMAWGGATGDARRGGRAGRPMWELV